MDVCVRERTLNEHTHTNTHLPINWTGNLLNLHCKQFSVFISIYSNFVPFFWCFGLMMNLFLVSLCDDVPFFRWVCLRCPLFIGPQPRFDKFTVKKGYCITLCWTRYTLGCCCWSLVVDFSAELALINSIILFCRWIGCFILWNVDSVILLSYLNLVNLILSTALATEITHRYENSTVSV